MATFQLKIITPQAIVFEGQVESLSAPGEDGYFGVLANHAPFLTTLQDGALELRAPAEDGAKTETWKISGGGFFEVHKNQAVVLAQNIQSAPASSGR